MENPDFLKKKYNLHNTEEVESANIRLEKRTGEKVPQDPKERIQNYLDRFTEIIERKEPGKMERGIEAIKKVIDDKYVIKKEEIPESYFDTQKKIAREQGHGDIEISDELREQLTEVIIKDQRDSLNNWIDYLSSKDATYPDWLKYYAIRNILGMGEYDKEKKLFTKRTKGTVKPFPDINREALAYVLDAIEKKYQGKISNQDQEFQTLLQGENFAKLYAWAIEKATPATESALTNTKGEWVKYRQGKDHMPLVESLQGHGTGWCTAGESTAKAQLQAGDFYVYYSYDQNNKPNIPRAAIRMQEGQIAEVRGIGPDQNLDPFVGDIVKRKLTEFPDGPKYEKKVTDMKLLTTIDNKVRLNQSLSKDELVFLYEIDNKIEGFGYQRDPRIKEIIDQRNPKEDAPIVLDCKHEQIATNEKEISKDTKVYIGELNMKVLKLLSPKIKHIYTKFPEQKVFYKEIIPDKEITSAETAVKKLEKEGHKISDYSKDMLTKVNWKEKLKTSYEIISLSVGELFGDTKIHTYADIKEKAKEFGLDLVPQKLAPSIRLNYEKSGEWTNVAMESIRDRDGNPSLFGCIRYGSESWLNVNSGRDGNIWNYDRRFFFVRK